jgi:sugar lactone lactonase YvrE
MLPYTVDGGDEAGVVDGSADGPIDAPGIDDGIDATGIEGGVDATIDATMDSPATDAGVDVTPQDAGTDAHDASPSDSGSDANDATSDAGDASDAADAADAGPPIVDQISGVVVSTLAGSGTAGSQDGNGTAATFDNPVGIALDALGNLLVTEYDGSRTRRITPAGDVTTFTAQSDLVGPFGITVASDGTVVVQTDFNENGIKNPTSGTLWKVLPGGFALPLVGGLGRPRGLAGLANDTIAVSDHEMHTLQILDPTSATMTPLAGSAGSPGFVDAVGSNARFNEPYGVAVFADGTILLADANNNRLRSIAPDGTVSTFAGDGTPGMIDGPRLSARMSTPRDVAIDAAGNVYFSDLGNKRIRRIDTTGLVQTVAGDGTAGFNDGTGDVAEFFGQEGLDVTPDGKTIYVVDGTLGQPGLPYNRVRMITLP